jgi:hypothetical protein
MLATSKILGLVAAGLVSLEAVPPWGRRHQAPAYSLTVAVLDLRSLSGRGGILDHLAATGQSVQGRAWKALGSVELTTVRQDAAIGQAQRHKD